jgi:ATP-dependent protease HslVU (ClpYQ) peptidase subunit
MTTVAYRDGVLAADSRVTVGDMVLTDKATKVHRLRDGHLFGWSGNAEDAVRLKQALQKRVTPPPDLDLSAILISPEGEIRVFEGNIWVTVKSPYYAVGTGANGALCAMDAGADAKTAALIGSKRDTSSGGKIKCVKLK